MWRVILLLVLLLQAQLTLAVVASSNGDIPTQLIGQAQAQAQAQADTQTQTQSPLSTSIPSQHAVDLQTHGRQLEEVLATVRTRTTGQPIVLKRSIAQSHCPRPQAYKSAALSVDLSAFDKVLAVEKVAVKSLPAKYRELCRSDEQVAIVDVQSMTSMEQLVDALLPLGLIPAVVPEFKGITVGGSIQGLAAESTSFRYGFFHNSVIGMEVVLPDGQVLWCSDDQSTELFDALPGSFGSLGICTRAKVLCIPATQYVKVCCSEYQSSASCIEALKLLQEYDIADKKAKVDFMEGFGFASDSFAVVKGSFVTNKEREESKCIPIVHCNRHGSRWFFNSVRDSLRKISRSLKGSPYNVGPTADVGSDLAESSTREISFLMTTKDYLFRHDRGSFWMASYRIPQIVGQWLMGSLLDSTNMFKLATALPWAFPKSVIVLQDFMLPFDNVDYFVNTLEEKLDLWPIWLLPMKNHQKANKALFGVPRSLSSHLCNVGAYGIPRKKYNFIPDNQMLEKLLHKCNGRKVFYSHAFYERNFFYEELYPGKEYFKLRRKYVSDESLPEIFDKVVTKNGKL